MYNLFLLSILRSCGISSEKCYLTEDYWIFPSTGLQRAVALQLRYQVKKLQRPASVLQTGVWAPSLNLQSALEREKRQNTPSNDVNWENSPPNPALPPLPSQAVLPRRWHVSPEQLVLPGNSGQHLQAGFAHSPGHSSALPSAAACLCYRLAASHSYWGPSSCPRIKIPFAHTLMSQCPHEQDQVPPWRIPPPYRAEKMKLHVTVEHHLELTGRGWTGLYGTITVSTVSTLTQAG